MANWEKFCQLAYWQQLTGNEFNRGYLTALALVFGILLVLLVLKIVFWICFRTRRCGNVVVRSAAGEVIVSRDAVCALLRRELRGFSQLEVRNIRIMRRGGNYFLHLHADFHTGENGLQVVLDEVRPRLLAALKETFGIVSIKQIKLMIDELVDDGRSEKRASSEAEATPRDRGFPPTGVI